MQPVAAKMTEEVLPAGRKVAGRYVIERSIGRGGMATVYSATDEQTGEKVALKIPFAAHVQDARTLRRFLREARTAATLSHPNAVRVIAVEEDGERPVMVMELLDGESLATRIREAGRLSLGETTRILVPVLAALAEAHARGVVHRDIKPDNIFLARVGGQVVPKVLDFGIAKVLHQVVSAESMKLTETGTTVGTPYYMAPEQAAARPTFDHRIDVWAIGVVLYEALSGTRPFDGNVYGQILGAIFGEGPPPIRARAPELPDPVVELIERCLRKRPDERPGSAGEIADVLASYASLPTMRYPKPGNTTHQVVSNDPVTPTAETVEASPGGQRAKQKEASRRGRIFAMAGAAAVALVAGVTWIGLRASAPEPIASPPVVKPEPAAKVTAPERSSLPSPQQVAKDAGVVEATVSPPPSPAPSHPHGHPATHTVAKPGATPAPRPPSPPAGAPQRGIIDTL